jgi:hypothetical protein
MMIMQFKWTSKKNDPSEKDKWEQAVEDSEISLAALVGELAG